MTPTSLLAMSASMVDTVTDVAGIAAVVLAVALLLVVETRRAAGVRAPRMLTAGAVLATVLALVIIGGRFQWLPNASDDGGAETASSETVDPESSTTSDEAGPETTAPPETTSPPETPTLPDPTATTVDSSDPESSSTTSTTSAPTVTVGPPTPPTTAGSEAPSTPVPDEEPAEPDSVDQPPVGDRGPPSTYEVEQGDNFWSIAEATLEDARGGPVSDAEIIPYWQQLIDANADDLVEPGNPDLILPGQMLDVPPVGLPSP